MPLSFTPIIIKQSTGSYLPYGSTDKFKLHHYCPILHNTTKRPGRGVKDIIMIDYTYGGYFDHTCIPKGFRGLLIGITDKKQTPHNEMYWFRVNKDKNLSIDNKSRINDIIRRFTKYNFVREVQDA